jgi:hypothetical protein
MNENVEMKHEFNILVHVINDLVHSVRQKIEAQAVGNPMSTPLLYLRSNCGNQVFQNSMVSPNSITNCMVSATIQNTFSAGYSIQAMGDAPIQIPTTYLNNLDFQLVDANFQPLRLLNPMYLTISTSPIAKDENNDLSQWNGRLPFNAPTPEQKAELDAKAKADAEAKEQAEAEAQAKEQMQATAFALVVQVLAPIAQEQVVQTQLALAQQQEQTIKQEVVKALLQEPDVIEFIWKMPKKDVIPFLDALTTQIIEQGTQEQQAEAPAQEPTSEMATTEQATPIETPVENLTDPNLTPPVETPVETPVEISPPLNFELHASRPGRTNDTAGGKPDHSGTATPCDARTRAYSCPKIDAMVSPHRDGACRLGLC